MVASDRRTSGTVLEDNTIQIKASNRISENLGERVHINVTSYNRQLLLTGEVPSEQDKQLAEKVVAGVENVRAVVNELAVLGGQKRRDSGTLNAGKSPDDHFGRGNRRAGMTGADNGINLPVAQQFRTHGD